MQRSHALSGHICEQLLQVCSVHSEVPIELLIAQRLSIRPALDNLCRFETFSVLTTSLPIQTLIMLLIRIFSRLLMNN